MTNIKVIIPAYNEADSIAKVIQDIPENVSEIVSESMTPEQEMTFAIAEFDLTSDLYLTMADANSGYREYAGRGFGALKVVPYLNGAPTTLSVVEEIPFID